MNLIGKVAWITGGTRMGAKIGETLSAKGCQVFFTYRKSKAAAERAVEILEDAGGVAKAILADLTQPATVRAAVKQIQKEAGRLDVLVNLASIYEESNLEKDTNLTSWQDHWEANAKASLVVSQAVAPLMRRSGAGRIVHVSDWTAVSGRPRYKTYGAYYVSKGAVKHIVESLALALAPMILVNAVAPGPILAPPGMSKKEIKDVEKVTPVGRWGGAEEIAKAVLFLAETDFVTGETIRVDGGRHLF